MSSRNQFFFNQEGLSVNARMEFAGLAS